MQELQTKLQTLRIFIDTDQLILNHLNKMTLTIKKFNDSLSYSGIKLSREIGEDKKELGDYLLSVVHTMDEFLSEYRDIKDTWGVTAPSSVLNDEK